MNDSKHQFTPRNWAFVPVEPVSKLRQIAPEEWYASQLHISNLEKQLADEKAAHLASIAGRDAMIKCLAERIDALGERIDALDPDIRPSPNRWWAFVRRLKKRRMTA